MSTVGNGNDNPVIAGAATPMNLGQTEPGFDRFGPLLDIQRFKDEYLFGIPLKSALTGQEISEDTLKSFIRKGVGDVETSVRIAVNPTKIEDRFDFERADDFRFGTRRATRWPILKVENLKALWPGRAEFDPTVSQEIDYPTSWVSLQGDTGLFRIVPNSGTLVNADVNFLSSSAYRSVVLGGLKNWPNMWRFTYWAGFDRDKVPEIVNDLIGTCAAMRAISVLGPIIFPFAGQSIGLDGMSQSVSTAGPQWLAGRLAELQAERDRLIQVLKQYYCTDMNFFAF